MASPSCWCRTTCAWWTWQAACTCSASDRSLRRAPWRRSNRTNACARRIWASSEHDIAAMIEVENLEAGYGEVPVLREVSLHLDLAVAGFQVFDFNHRSEEHTSELQPPPHLVSPLLFQT